MAVRQEHTGFPFTRTVQAPQSPASQPTLVPVRRNSSRRTVDRRVRGSESTGVILPFKPIDNLVRVSTFRAPWSRTRQGRGAQAFLRLPSDRPPWREYHQSEIGRRDDLSSKAAVSLEMPQHLQGFSPVRPSELPSPNGNRRR